ncbi:MAG: hypothetical protein JWL95_3245 [Gemmatimonadetes bacterium]|nr:hypothetical protein [Gemmatimonadota bacterium]
MSAARMMMGIGVLVAAPFVYSPSLADVGHGSAYFPGDVSQDARALNFLGFMSDSALTSMRQSTGTKAGDMASNAGAWAPEMRAASGIYQTKKGLTPDGWIGPQTRGSLATSVAFQNANPGTLPAVIPPGLNVPIQPGNVPVPNPPATPGVTPVASTTGDDTLLYAGLGLGAVLLVGLGIYALS